MNCKEFKSKWMDVVEKNAPADQLAPYVLHMEHCPACEQLYHQLRSCMQTIEEDKQMEPNPYLAQKIEARLAATSTDNLISFSLSRSWFTPIVVTMTGVIVGLFLSWMLGIMDTGNDTVSPPVTTEQMADQQEMNTDMNVLTLNE